MSVPNYLSIKQFAEKHKFYPLGRLRSRIFFADSNGMAEQGVILREGRRVFVNETKFFTWLESHSTQEVRNEA